MLPCSRFWRKFQKQISNGKHLGFYFSDTFSTNTAKRKPIESTTTTNQSGKTSNEEKYRRMFAWQIHSYGTLDELQFTNNSRLPVLMSPNEVLVKVLATSVNPIDTMMISGYGSQLLNMMRQLEHCSFVPELEFPLILGRDCCGEVVAKGNNVGRHLNVGDIVYGVVPVHQQGCHAENVLLNKDLVRVKPNAVTVEEASSLLFAGMTAWSALKITGDLFLIPSEKKKVLVIGASGGVGTLAVQLLKAWKAEVVAVCGEDAVPLVNSLKADHVIDYSKQGSFEQIREFGKYDIILDVAGLPETEISKYVELLKNWSFAKYITLKSPFLRNVDNLGFLGGLCKNVKDIVSPNLSTIATGSSVRWGFFMPLPNGISEIHQLVATKQIRPVVQKVYNFSQLPEAYKTVENGHLRGKVVIKVQ